MNKQELIASIENFKETFVACRDKMPLTGETSILRDVYQAAISSFDTSLAHIRQLDEPSSPEGCEKIYCKTYDLKGYKCFNCSKCGAWQVDLPNTRVCTFCGRRIKTEEMK